MLLDCWRVASLLHCCVCCVVVLSVRWCCCGVGVLVCGVVVMCCYCRDVWLCYVIMLLLVRCCWCVVGVI